MLLCPPKLQAAVGLRNLLRKHRPGPVSHLFGPEIIRFLNVAEGTTDPTYSITTMKEDAQISRPTP